MNYHRKYYREYYDDDPISGAVVLMLMFLGWMYFADKAKFWHWVIILMIGLAFIIGLILLWKWFKREHSWNRMVGRIDSFDAPQSNPIQNNLNNPTPQAQALYEALMKKRIKCKVEQWDGHKHVDISIPWAKINIEVDGSQHFTNAEQMTSDLYRTQYSSYKGIRTIHIPNRIIETNLEEVAETIARTARVMYFRSRFRQGY